MPQETNLNVAPYFDDFDPSSNYYKVLFKPSYPVQARELNNLQSILQDQVEKFGNHVFKEGAKVIPGQLTYLSDFNAIQIEDTFLGVPVSIYLDQLIGKTIKGSSSGVTAQVVKYITNEESERGNYTLYVNYFESSNTDAETEAFFSDEVLTLTEPIQYATTFIAAGEGFAKSLTQNASAVGSAFALSTGVYYLRGHFVSVYDDILILDQYSNKPNFRIGFNVREEILSSDVDPTLNDNAQGFNNYTAPGADRVKITATLSKRDSDDFEDSNFVQIAEVKNGYLRDYKENTDYNYLGDELARRTFDESGNYYVKEFVTSVKDSLNTGYGNRGLFGPDQVTDQGSTPSDDLAIYKVAPGKAYVKGYEVDVRGPSYLDAPKPRTTNTLESQGINFGFGPTFTVNRSYGSPVLGFADNNVISMRSERIESTHSAAAGKEIGVARIYDIALESGSYDTTTPDLNQWDVSLFDVQTYTEFEINKSSTLTIPTYVKGENSGATAYLRHAVTGVGFTAYDVNGEFFIGEKLTFNGDQTTSRTVTKITNFEISDAKSLYSDVGGKIFNADLIPTIKTTVGIASIKAESGGQSVITSPSTTWPGITTAGNLISYSVPTNDVPSLAKVVTVSLNQLVVEPVENVTNYIVGDLPSTDISVTDLSIVETKKQRQSDTGNIINSESLFSVAPKRNLSEVDTTSSKLVIRRSFTVSITNNTMSSVSTGANETFLPFDEERYTLIRSNGQTETLTQDRFSFTNGLTTLTINGLGANDSGATLITTISKDKIKSKIKKKNINQSVIIDKSTNPASGTGENGSLNDGLTYGNYPFGTRVQDEQISINVPDVSMLYALYESETNLDPVLPSMTTGSLDGPTATTDDIIIGDTVVGTLSGAKGFVFERKSDTSINYIFETNTLFANGEVINFTKSGVSAVALNIDKGSKNILVDYTVQDGQTDTFYGISKIKRISDASVPTGRLKACFVSSSYDSSDDGDITTTSSYSGYNFTTDITTFNGYRLSDMIDARPRVSPYTVAAGQRSPFEFFGRSFTGNQHSSKDIIASDEAIVVDFSYYVGRIDRIYLNHEGKFIIKYGVPSDNPQKPDPISNAMNIANVTLPPYLYRASDARIEFISHKRYQMSDISKLEKRIHNLEYYTSLSQLETNAINQFTPDANGLDRFKSGIFIDNFTTTIPQDPQIGIKNCVDKSTNICRPSHYTNVLNLVLGNTTIPGVGEETDANEDSRFADLLGTNVRRNDEVLSLDYTEVEWLKNPFATRSESVTPFLVKFWAGSITMTPNSDVWIDVNQMEANNVEIEGAFESLSNLVGADISTNEDGNRVGITPVIWESWETNDVDMATSSSTSSDTSTSSRTRAGSAAEFNATRRQPNISIDPNGASPPTFRITDTESTTTTTTTVTSTINLEQSRSGEQITITERIDTESLGERVVSRELLHFMRSRNLMTTATSLKPYSRVYSFFDSVDVNRFCFSKLLEIEMSSGTFQVGETVVGTMPIAEDNDDVLEGTVPAITFRVATSNHKYGPYNNPTDRFDSNPYDRELNISPEYSETSTTLNIDTFSLQDMESPAFEGFISETMVLRGQSSGAEAVITNNRLISDRLGTLICMFQVPPSNNEANPIFETGTNRIRLTGSPTNSKVEGTFTTSAETTFYSEGSIDMTQETTLSLSNADVEVNDEFFEERTLTDTSSTSTSTSESGSGGSTFVDPLAQSFIVDDPTGVFLSSIDVFFQAKPEVSQTPVTCQIRTIQLGTPTTTILPYSEVDIDPRDITVSQDSSVATNIKFKAPVFVEPFTEYCVVLLSHNTEYRVWISQLGEVDVSTLGQEEGQILVSTQPLLGSLFKSQNASTWTPSQYEDLTFTLYRADFDTSGSAQFFNPDLPKKLETISKNNIQMGSREVRMETSGIVTSSIEPGDTIIQTNTNAFGKFESFGGSVNGLTITNPGIGYTPSAGYYVFTGIELTSLTGTGINATASIAIENGVGLAATITNAGSGHQVGDLLSPISIGNVSLGQGMKITVDSISGNNQLNITGIQGRFSTNSADVLKFTNNLGVTTDINGGGVYPESPIRVTQDGSHMNVKFRNHGMHSGSNVVRLSNVETDVPRSALLSDYSITSTGNISIGATDNFANFEGVGVGATNPGYIKIGDEIISYTGYSGNELTGITRGVDNTVVASHKENNSVRLYEINGVSLRRINRIHNFNDVTEENPRTLDSYKLKVDVTDTTYGTNRGGAGTLPELFFKETKNGGGNRARSTYNQPFQIVIPKFNYITPTGTSLNANIRTITGSSISGNEPPFVDKGFTPITFKRENYFEYPRIIASKVNEDQYLDDLPANKSLTVTTNLNSSDSRLSPMIDLNRTTMVLISNRANSVIDDYSSDPRANTIGDDPTAFIYATKRITLSNPSTSIKVTFDAYVNTFCDVRVFYSFSDADDIRDATFIPFPGYRNSDASGRPGVIADASLSDGTPDVKTPKSDRIFVSPPPEAFREFQFTADLLPAFTTFRIKVLGTTTNQSVVPQMRNIRVVALA